MVDTVLSATHDDGRAARPAAAADRRLSVPRSPYRWRPRRVATDRQGPLSIGVHVVAWLLTVAWLSLEIGRDSSEPTIPIILLVGSTFLLVAPALVVRWERKLRLFEDEVHADRALGADAWRHLASALDAVTRYRHAIVGAPVVLIVVAYLTEDRYFADEMSLPEGGVEYLVGLAVLALGSFAAGWGIYAAAVTLALAVGATDFGADFAPFAGTPSRAARALQRFCFSSAMMYGAAGALLAPGLCVAAWVADGVAQAAIVAAISLVLVTTAALLAVPATVLSLRSEDDRADYLDGLSAQIDELGSAASDPSTSFDETQYMRLRALLEMRAHVVGHSVENSSVEMVKRIPVVVLLPTASVVASWCSLVAT